MPCAPVADRLGLASLAERRRHIGCNFLKRLLLAAGVDSPTLVSLLNFKVLQRSSPTFYIFHKVPPIYTKNEPIRRLMFDANTDATVKFYS